MLNLTIADFLSFVSMNAHYPYEVKFADLYHPNLVNLNAMTTSIVVMEQCNLFIWFEPHNSWRKVIATEQRTKIDFAHQMKALVDECPEAKKIRVVLDNLNTHTTAALYQAFPPETRKSDRLQIRVSLHS